MTPAYELAREAIRLQSEAERLWWLLEGTPGDRGGRNGPHGRAAAAFREADQAARDAAIRCCMIVAGTKIRSEDLMRDKDALRAHQEALRTPMRSPWWVI